MKRHLLPIIAIFFSTSFLAQSIVWSGSVEGMGIASTKDYNPFWFYTNTATQVGSASNFSGLGRLESAYTITENASLTAGASFFYRDEVKDEFQRNDLFLQFQNSWIKATVGAKTAQKVQYGLSATNKNILFSNNTRPFPGLLLEANNPIKLSETFSVDWGIGHFVLNDDRFVDNVKLHYKRVALHIDFKNNNRVRAQIQHYVQWGGTSPEYGKLKSDFNAFIDVFTARKSSEIGTDGELFNAVGNHLGSYLLEYGFKNNVGNFSMYHDHPFEDGSGTAFANFPDGAWGAYFEPAKSKIVTAFLYEFITTNNQSKGGVGADNYFSNAIYRSGWTYEQNIIGLPFIMVDPTVEISPENNSIISNRVIAHHFGFAGTVKGFLWEVKSSSIKSLGRYSNPFPKAIKTFNNYLSIKYPTQEYGTFHLFGGIDTSNIIDTVMGAGLGYSYKF
ncbi:MAG: capsule assembly Wzi family protein [Flavobacteriaceae bacterium]